ncbi:MAG: hypothetical protein LBQ86_05535 [Holophagales bacterium]|jgi:hypothetical protein|nr:hypothetical protein [Holophagales bacterium]
MLPALLLTISLSVFGGSENPEITSPQTGDYFIYGAERDREVSDDLFRCCMARFRDLGCHGVGNNLKKQAACEASLLDCFRAAICN